MAERRRTRRVAVGDRYIGGNAPILIQSMTNTDTADVDATIGQILALERAGCELVRVAAYDRVSASAIGEIKRGINIPIVADVHFDHRIALEAIASGADKIRINPGNIGSADKVREVAHAASDAGIPIRVGANTGSIRKNLRELDRAEALVRSTMENVEALEECGFFDIVLSVKSSSAAECIETARRLSELTEHPLHLGVTEAGSREPAAVKSALALGALLFDGIGDTIRVSVTGSPVGEIAIAKRILQFMGIRSFEPEIISCPTCARTHGDLERMVERIEDRLSRCGVKVKVAVMGCEVNGPGEAADADLGIALGRDCALLFQGGRVLKRLSQSDAEEELIRMVLEADGGQ